MVSEGGQKILRVGREAVAQALEREPLDARPLPEPLQPVVRPVPLRSADPRAGAIGVREESPFAVAVGEPVRQDDGQRSGIGTGSTRPIFTVLSRLLAQGTIGISRFVQEDVLDLQSRSTPSATSR